MSDPERVDRLMASGKFEAAAAMAAQILQKGGQQHPDVAAKLLSRRSEALLRAGRADEARMEAATLVRLKPEWSQGYQRLGEALLELQEFEEAEENFSKGTKLAPTNRDMQSLLKKSRVQTARAMGNAAFQEKSYEEASKHYELAIKLDSSDPEVFKVLSNLSACAYSVGDFAKALQSAESSIRLNPNWSKSHGRKGAALAGLGQASAAAAAYRRALELDPNNASTASALARLLGESGSAPAVSTGVRAASGVRQTYPPQGAAAHTPAAPRDQGELSSVSAGLIAGAAGASGGGGGVDLRRRESRGYAGLGTGTRERPSTASVPATSHSTSDSNGGVFGGVSVTNRPGGAYSMAGAGMRERVQQPVTAQPDATDTGPRSLGGSGTRTGGGAAGTGAKAGGMKEEWKRGNEAFAAKDYSKAIQHYSQAVRLDPLNHILYSNRSAAYASLMMWDKAIADGNECVRLRPDWAKGYCRLGAAFEGQHNLAQAEAAYTEGLEREPENALLQISLFRVCSSDSAAPAAPGTGPVSADGGGGVGGQIHGPHAVSGRGQGREGPAVGYMDPKQLGNAAFRQRDFDAAVDYFTQALDKETDGHIRALLLSNRSAALANLSRFEHALQDAQRCIEARPNWSKSRHRQAIALLGLGRHDEAVHAFQIALRLEGENGPHAASLRQGLENARRMAAEQTRAEAAAAPEVVHAADGSVFVRNDPLFQELERGLPEEPKDSRGRSRGSSSSTLRSALNSPTRGRAPARGSSSPVRRSGVRPKKRLSWDPRPNQVFYIQHSSEELASRKAHWRQIESDASRMAQSAGAVWTDNYNLSESHPGLATRNYGVD